jgi:hypothetical protein
MRKIQRCESTEPFFVQQIPSESKPGWVYEVHSIFPLDDAEEYVCGCPAFRYRGYCKHQQMAWYDRCLWTEEEDGHEEQTQEQKDKLICPRCGQKTLKDEIIDD